MQKPHAQVLTTTPERSKMDAVELHVRTENKEETMTALSEFCEARGFDVIRLFWRGVEPEDYEE